MTIRPPSVHPFSVRLYHRRFCVFFPRSQLLSQNICQEIAYHFRGSPLHIAGDVSVGVQGERRPGMAQNAGQGFHIHARRQSVSCEGVPKLVEAENEAILVEVENGT